MSSRKCKYDVDAFCFICGQFIKVRDVKYELKTSHVLCEVYEAYFDCPVRNHDKPWAPRVACSYCKRCLEGWYMEAFGYLKKIPKLSEAKVKAGVFVGPQIRQIFADEKFSTLLNRTQNASWNSSKAVVSGFLGNNKAENYEKLVGDMLTNFKALCCRMSLKVHIMLHAHLDKFKNNMGAYSEEQGERFHQDIMNFEQRYQGQYNENMMGDYI